MMFLSPAMCESDRSRKGQVEVFLGECFSSYDLFLKHSRKTVRIWITDGADAESTSLLLDPKPSQALPVLSRLNSGGSLSSEK